jgi:hypothetical protein
MVGLLVSISGHELEIDENEPGYYSFNMRAMYYLGGDNKDWKGRSIEH